ncbi:hypothetical protein ACOI1C_12650 [Bacillus sp. DJP31]|uniref:hypothetical protein n=1 Tax=Bacillus sp. DJP31 TaxID=3409789 RepID=UPI003BB61AB6
MEKEYSRRRRIADLSQDFSKVTNGFFEIINYKEKRAKDNMDLLLATIPFKGHPTYGDTIIYVRELYDEIPQFKIFSYLHTNTHR